MLNTTEHLLPVGEHQIQKKIRVYNLSRTIKYLAIFDIIISIYYTFSVHWSCIFLILFSLCGFYGSKTFKSNYIILFFIERVLSTIVKCIILYINLVPIIFIFNVLSILFEIYYLLVIKNFYIDLKELSDESLEELKQLKIEMKDINIEYL